MATKTTKTFNAQTATLAELNRELKRLASAKCRAKTTEARDAAAAEYAAIDSIKQARFGRKHFIDWSADEIAKCDLNTAIRGTKSLQSAKTLYPNRHSEILPKLALFIARRDELTELAKFEELKAKLGR